MNFIDLFSGIGGFFLGAQWAGWEFEKEFHSDIDVFANKVYAKNFPNSVQLGDITKINYEKLREENKGEWIATGGFPCQPHSIAGKRKGSEDERDLWSECVRMLRELRPKYAIFENVPALFIPDERRFFNKVLTDISEEGYNAEWEVISAEEIHAIHQRKRIWIVAYNSKIRRANSKVDIKKRIFSENSEKIREEWKSFQYRYIGNNNAEFREEDKSRICRMDDGFSKSMDRDRIGVLGNSIVPQIAEIIFRQIKQVENEQ